MSIHILSPADAEHFAALIRLFCEAFEAEGTTPPSLAYLEQRLQDPAFLVMVALQDGTPAGGLTAYRLHNYYTQKPMIYLYDIAVATTHRRQGIGRALLDALRQYAATHGYDEVYVQAEADDTEALAFYHSTPFSHALGTVQFSYEVG